ncbi:DNA-binding transcriptional regulator, MerR family [Pseudobutyrivibrio sp. UC1225]|uniref:MerR family transcriptional regulator n=1 Tax=Pseudobutyrivibrio sp. UC1225 TaxID=1798185 RepID=UPI0008F391A3|nr:MerR family transcriptional regulator [Pseudobutyrivibrio sp. UC1225]SFO18989.1 DNA-binding transcriptional regulator, MerR family [Pseudobutyrivibrio sp. UC1225]
MKINQVEELVGITKKNIRFYEDQGLITPKRNSENGYREYSLEDVKVLNQIKLLRRLEVPIEEIRKLQVKEISLDDCLQKQKQEFAKRQKDMDILSQLCQEIIDANDELEDMDVEKYLDDMKRLEKGGVSFMDINKIDVKKAKRGPKIAASVFIIIMIAFIALMVLGKITDPETPMFFIILMIGLCAAAIIGVSLALSQRLKEIDGGEQNEANKY